ncbi:MAG: CHASE3 domain-containing protein [Verrucomicrobia bacterium]|nr:CHASE3 domain-containing protein [Verrucomicrobiota bacterium]
MKWLLPNIISLGFGFALILLCCVGVVSYVNTQELIRDIRMVGHTYQVQAQLETVFGLVKDMQASGRGYVLTGEGSFLEPYRGATKVVQDELNQLRGLIQVKPPQLSRFETLASLVKQEMEYVENLVSLRQKEGLQVAVARIQRSEGKNIVERTGSLIQEMADAEDQLLHKREEKAGKSATAMIAVIIGGSSLAIILVALATIIVYHDSKTRDTLKRAVIEISEREQQRIGRDLHDGLCQQLTGIGLLSKAVKKKLVLSCAPEADEVRRVEELTTKAVGSARGIARGLCPVEVETNGLMSALEELAAHTQEVSGMECRFACPAPVLIENNVVATHLYRIAQEAVHNAMRHSEARQITIRLLATDHQIRLEIRDDGKGLPKSMPRTRGMGLDMMRYRAGAMGGSLEVGSLGLAGTVVTCTLDLKRCGNDGGNVETSVEPSR